MTAGAASRRPVPALRGDWLAAGWGRYTLARWTKRRSQRRTRPAEGLPFDLEPGDIIDEQSGLTADDIDTLISFVDDFPSSD
jgi:hypothetical protein